MKSALQIAAKMNYDLVNFWELTPYEFSLIAENYVAKQRAEREEKISLTYLGAYLERVKDFPRLDDLLARISKEEPKKEELAPEEKAKEMLNKIMGLNATFGGEVT